MTNEELAHRAGYLASLPPQPTMIELLERIHTPNALGPGPAQHPRRA